MKRSRDKSLVALVVVFLLITVGIRFEVFTPKQPPVPLFPLRPGGTDKTMYDHLRDAGFRIEMSGAEVLIDPRQRTQAQASLLAAGLPDTLVEEPVSSGDRHFHGHSPRSIRVVELEALVSEVFLELDQVAQADVKMTIPEKTYFQDDAKKATCVIKVQTWSGEPLVPQVRSATPYLLNRFVEDFRPETVTIVENSEE
ncbi:MAG: hypothetical protein KC800_16850 [Candidatus Eremiobacteraeota bacterium]|nr:hypothetical protein [Candidatus Eremiobacteraeota bacterium]